MLLARPHRPIRSTALVRLHRRIRPTARPRARSRPTCATSIRFSASDSCVKVDPTSPNPTVALSRAWRCARGARCIAMASPAVQAPTRSRALRRRARARAMRTVATGQDEGSARTAAISVAFVFASMFAMSTPTVGTATRASVASGQPTIRPPGRRVSRQVAERTPTAASTAAACLRRNRVPRVGACSATRRQMSASGQPIAAVIPACSSKLKPAGCADRCRPPRVIDGFVRRICG